MSAARSQLDGWRADLRLRFVARAERTYLAERQHIGPLVIQRPFYPEGDVCHVYIVHPPGGVVGGDELHIEVTAEPDARVLLTTPAAAKFYRSGGPTARLTQKLAAHDAAIEWLPQENIYYREARVRSDTHVSLCGRSRFVGWEVACLGLPAREEVFDCGVLRLGFELEVDGVPRAIDRLHIDGAHAARTAQWGLAGHTAIGTMLAYPADTAMLDRVRDIALPGAELAFSVIDEVLVCRCLGLQAAPVRSALVHVWKSLRPMLMMREAVPPRIWEK